MTERKSTEIKIRVTPSEKARWQADAEREGVSLSELLCRRMNFRLDLTLQEMSVASSAVARWDEFTHPARHEGQTPPERRTEPCPHSKPSYAFCPTCDK